MEWGAGRARSKCTGSRMHTIHRKISRYSQTSLILCAKVCTECVLRVLCRYAPKEAQAGPESRTRAEDGLARRACRGLS